ncbi:MAG: hypothetical protein JRI44_13170 [Deltaproteobacteria bacterium]|nr:hypothetical protein [Deltaproteobacteria bacterium]
MKKNIINLTPHPLVFMDEDKNILFEIPSSGIARASQKETKIGELNGLPVYKMEYGKVENLPAPKKDTIYVVSLLTAQAVPERQDVFVVAHPVRDEKGRIIGAQALAHI